MAVVGGLNFGDEYLGRSAAMGPWRDTHLRIAGPTVQAVPLAFVEEWFWAAHELPELSWEPQVADEDGKRGMAKQPGPAEVMDTFTIFLLERSEERQLGKLVDS